jgi:hypothetical protein
MARYPSAEDIAEMRARGYDSSVIDEAIERSRRRETIEQVKTRIRAAFAGVRLGAGIGLREAQAMDDCADDETRARCREMDEKNDWQAIRAADLRKCHSSLDFFDGKGMRFHLPAYLIADLDGDYGFGMEFHLTQCPGAHECFFLLNAAQRRAVGEYLHFIKDEPDYAMDREDIQGAIVEYWH